MNYFSFLYEPQIANRRSIRHGCRLVAYSVNIMSIYFEINQSFGSVVIILEFRKFFSSAMKHAKNVMEKQLLHESSLMEKMRGNRGLLLFHMRNSLFYTTHQHAF